LAFPAQAREKSSIPPRELVHSNIERHSQQDDYTRE
jgi:hypothetical protein